MRIAMWVLLVGLVSAPSMLVAGTLPYGVGKTKCADVPKYTGEETVRTLPAQWLLGYLTAIHKELPVGADFLSDAGWTEADFIFHVFHQHCDQYPDDNLAKAVHAAIQYVKTTPNKR